MKEKVLQSKENFLEAIKFGKPEYIPMECEQVIYSFSFEDIVKMESYTDRWGVKWEVGLKETVPFPKGNPLKDILKLDDYKFPNPDGLELSEKVKQELAQVDREQKLVFGNMSYLLFERVWSLMGMDNFFITLLEYPDKVHYLLHQIAIYARKVFERYIDLGADGISFSEDLGSQRALMISPLHFQKFLLPEYKFIFENMIRDKKIINFHSCGCVNTIAGDLSSIGINILNPIQARANDLHRLKADTVGKMALSGGIDTHLIMSCTPEQVRKETIRVLEILRPCGGYICGPDQYLPDMPKENLDALWSTVREFGRY